MTKIDLEALDRADEIESVDSMLRRLLPVVADSWEQLRGSDVYRLLSMVREDRRAAAAKRLRFIRQDLIGRVDDAIVALVNEGADDTIVACEWHRDYPDPTEAPLAVA